MMANISIATINTAIKNTLSAATGLVRSQNYNELTEGMQDYPTLQVFWESGETDITANNDRTTFGGSGAPVRQKDLVFHANCIASQRSELAEDMEQVITLASAVWDILEAQVNPLYGNANIKAHHWTAQRVNFKIGDENYPGIQFVINVRVF